MSDASTKIEPALAMLFAEGGGDVGQHPSLETLGAYQGDQLAAPEEERVQEHLSLCDQCADLVLDLGRFESLKPPTPAHRLSAKDLMARRSNLEQRLEELDKDTDQATSRPLALVSSRHPPAPPAAAIPRWYHTLVAALVVSVLALAQWTANLRSALEAPVLNVVLGDLDYNNPRGQGEVTIPADADQFLLLLNTAEFTERSEYRLEVLDEQAKIVWASTGLQPISAGTFSAGFRRDFLGPGRYEARLLGKNGDSFELIKVYAFQLKVE